MKVKLTNTWLGKVQPIDINPGFKPEEDREVIVTDTEATGLRVRITSAGTKTFYCFYKINGKPRKYRIGRFGDIGVPTARDATRKIKAQVALGNDPQTERMSERNKKEPTQLRYFLDKHYYPWANQHQKAPWRTRQILERNYASIMSKRIDKVVPFVIDKWRQEKLESGLKPSTLNRSITSIKAVLNKAVEWGFIETSPLHRYKKLKIDKKGVVRYLNPEEEKRLYGVLSKRKGQLPAIVKLLHNTGARPAEIFNLRWKNVNENHITLESAYTKTGQTRHIPLNDKSKAALNSLDKEGEWVFPGQEGKPITTIQKGFNNIIKEAGIENFRLYDLRHSFASKLVMNGIDLYAIAELLGHSDIEMTKIYAHLSPEHLQKAVDVM